MGHVMGLLGCTRLRYGWCGLKAFDGLTDSSLFVGTWYVLKSSGLLQSYCTSLTSALQSGQVEFS